MTSLPPPPPPPASGPPAGTPPGPPVAPGAQPGWGAPPAAAPAAYGPPRTEGLAIAALILAILSFFICPLIPAIVALALAHAAGNKIDASGGRLQGNGLVKAAQIVAWIHIGLLTVVAVLAAILLVANDSSATSLRALAVVLG